MLLVALPGSTMRAGALPSPFSFAIGVFWLISNNQPRAAELGIHAAHQTAVGQRVVPGMTYEIELRATGDMTIRPIDENRAAVNENPAPAQPPN